MLKCEILKFTYMLYVFPEVIRQEGINNWLHSIYEDEDVSDADKQLAIGATIVEEMRAAVYEKTGFRCSAGIAHNKVNFFDFLRYRRKLF